MLHFARHYSVNRTFELSVPIGKEKRKRNHCIGGVIVRLLRDRTITLHLEVDAKVLREAVRYVLHSESMWMWFGTRRPTGFGNPQGTHMPFRIPPSLHGVCKDASTVLYKH